MFVAQPGPEEDEHIQEYLENGMGNRAMLAWMEGNVAAAANAGLDGQTVDVKFIPWQTWAEFYDNYLLHSCDTLSEKAGMNCFRACFEKKWSNIIKFVVKVEHRLCSTCAELKKRMRTEQNQHELELVQNAYRDRIERNSSDRSMDARLEHLSECSTMWGLNYVGLQTGTQKHASAH